MSKRSLLHPGVLALLALPLFSGCASRVSSGPQLGTRNTPNSVLPFGTVSCGDGADDPIDRVTRNAGYAEVATRDIAHHAEERFGGIAPVDDVERTCEMARLSNVEKRPRLSKPMLEQLRASGRDAALVTSVDTFSAACKGRNNAPCADRQIRAYAYLFASDGELRSKSFGTWAFAERESVNAPPSFRNLAAALLDEFPKESAR